MARKGERDIAVLADVRVVVKEREKTEKYQDLKREIGRLWKLKMVEGVPIMIGTLVSQKKFDGWIDKLRRRCKEEITLLVFGHLL